MPKVLSFCALAYVCAVWVGQWIGASASAARLALVAAILAVSVSLLARWLLGLGLLGLTIAAGLQASTDRPTAPRSPQLDALLATGPHPEPLFVSVALLTAGKPLAHGLQVSVALLSGLRSNGQGGCLDPAPRSTLLIHGTPDVPLLPGDVLRLRAVLHSPSGEEDEEPAPWASPFGAKPTALVAHADAAQLVRLSEQAVADCPPTWKLRLHWLVKRPLERLRQRLRTQILAQPSPAESRAVLVALTLGSRGPLLEADERRLREGRSSLSAEFSAAGIAHILSVSGLHLALVGWLLYRIIGKVLSRSAWLAQRFAVHRFAAALTLPLMLSYAELTGSELPTLRAACVLGLWLLALLFGRRTTLTQGLALSVFVLGAPVPAGGALRLCDPSWLLSMAATLGMTYLHPIHAQTARLLRIEMPQVLRRPLGWLLRLSDATLGATIATAPLCALLFGKFVAMGLVANLVLVPIGELAVLPIGLLGLCLGQLCGWLGNWTLQLALLATTLLLRLTALFASVGLAWTVPSPPLAWLLLFALGVLLWASQRPLGGAICGLAVLLYLADWQRPKAELRLTALAVGQGDSIVVEFPTRQVMVIDAGPASSDGYDAGLSTVGPFLRRRGISRIDWLVMTHAHPDHSGGLPALLHEFSVGELWIDPLPGRSNEQPTTALRRELQAAEATLANLMALAQKTHTRVVPAHPLQLGSASVETLSSPNSTHAAALRGLNDASTVLRLRYAGKVLLLTGDIEAEREAELVGSGQLSHADVLKAPHHCSKTSSTALFVAAVRPSFVICSVGKNNRFGFPHSAVVQRYQAIGSTILRTAQRGSFTISASEKGTLTVRSATAPRFFF